MSKANTPEINKPKLVTRYPRRPPPPPKSTICILAPAGIFAVVHICSCSNFSAMIIKKIWITAKNHTRFPPSGLRSANTASPTPPPIASIKDNAREPVKESAKMTVMENRISGNGGLSAFFLPRYFWNVETIKCPILSILIANSPSQANYHCL